MKVSLFAQAMQRIPLSRKQKVIDKSEELETLDVIKKVDGPTSWIYPLPDVEKSNGEVHLCLDMREANQAIVRDTELRQVPDRCESHGVPWKRLNLQRITSM